MSETIKLAVPVEPADQAQAIAAVLRATMPDPTTLLAEVRAYVDARMQASVDAAPAAWTSDWLERRDEWRRRIGPLWPASKVADVSPTMKTAAAVSKARGEGRLLALEIGDRVYFPAFQFKRDGSPAAWVREIVSALPDSDTLLQFFSAERPALDGRSYAETLRAGKLGETGVRAMVDGARAIAAAEAR